MSTKRSYVVFYHDTGYGDDLLLHINEAIRGRDMIAESVHSVPPGATDEDVVHCPLKDILCRFQAYVERGRTPRQAISDTYRFYGVKED